MAKFKKDQQVIHVKSLARGVVQTHDGDKVTYLKEDGTTSTVNAASLQTISKWEGEQARAKKKADNEAAKKARAAERANRPPRQAASKEGYRKSGQLEYDPSKYIARDGVKTAAGNKITDIGDEAADEMAGKTFDEMVAIVARATGTPKDELIVKYEKLNPGMQRMTLGNRLRAALRIKAAGGDPTAPKVKKTAAKPGAKAEKRAKKAAPAKKAAAKSPTPSRNKKVQAAEAATAG